jgi:hypothetical protein
MGCNCWFWLVFLIEPRLFIHFKISFPGIYSSLANAERARLRGENEEEDFVGGFEASSLFSKGKVLKKGESIDCFVV